jgi:hypothetical protein
MIPTPPAKSSSDPSKTESREFGSRNNEILPPWEIQTFPLVRVRGLCNEKPPLFASNLWRTS